MFLCNPNGETAINPTPDYIREMLRKGKEYWLAGCGQVTLSKYKDFGNSKNILLCFWDEKYGFVIMDLREYKAALGNNDKKELFVATDDGGGNPLPIPLCCFINEQQAEKIFLHFLEFEEFLDYSNWHDIYQGYDYERFEEELMHNCGFNEVLKIEDGKLVKAFGNFN
jgi:hypothetical protein